MINMTTGKLALWAFGLTFIYILAVVFVPLELLISILNGVFLGVALAVTAIYVPLVFYSLKEDNFGRGIQLSVGIGLLWLSMIISRLWAFYYRYNGSPEGLLTHPVIGYVILLAVIAGCLFVTAPGYYPPEIPTIRLPFGGRNRVLLFCFAFVGGALGFFLYYR